MTSFHITSSISELFKENYGLGYEVVTYRDHPALAMVKKRENATGKYWDMPVVHANPQGRSADYATAKSTRTASKQVEFHVTLSRDYQMVTVDGLTMKASKGDGAFVEALQHAMDTGFMNITQSLARAIYGTGSGAIGQISSGSNVATDTITLANIYDIVNFSPGMTLVSSATETGSARANSEVLEAVDQETGQLTATSAAWNTVATDIAAGDYLFQDGDNNAKIKGFGGWIPATVTATTFYGVNRSVSPTKLAGIRYDASSAGDTHREGIINLTTLMALHSTVPARNTVIFMNPIDVGALVKEYDNKVEYTVSPPAQMMGAGGTSHSVAEVGFEAIKIYTGRGPLKVMVDHNCPYGTGFAIELDCTYLTSLGPAPQVLSHDGNRTLRDGTIDGITAEIGYYAALAIQNPNSCGRITFAAA